MRRFALLLLLSITQPLTAQQAKPATDANGDPLPTGAIARLGSMRLRQGEGIRGLAFAPCGHVLASYGMSHKVHFWDVDTGKEIRTLVTDSYLHSFAYSPDGKIVATGHADQKIRLWETASGKLLHALAKHKGYVSALAFSSNGKWLASSSRHKEDRAVQLWEVERGRHVREFTGHEDGVNAMVFSGDGELLFSAGKDGTLFKWETNTGNKLEQVSDVHSERLWLAQDGKTLFGWGTYKNNKKTSSQTVLAWATATLDRRPPPVLTESDVTAAAISADSRIAAISERSEILLADTANGRKILRLQDVDSIAPLALSPDAKYLAGADGNRIRLWEVSRGREVHVFPGHQDELRFVRYLPGEKEVLSIDRGGKVCTWEIRSGKLVREFHVTRLLDWKSQLSPDGKILLVGGVFGPVNFWNVEAGKQIRSLDRGWGSGACFSPDGKMLAIGGTTPVKTPRMANVHNFLTLLDARSGQTLHEFTKQLQEEDLSSLTFSPDGKYLLYHAHGVHLWDVQAKKEVQRFKNTQGSVWRFLGAGAMLVSYEDYSDAWNASALELFFWSFKDGGLIRRVEFPIGVGQPYLWRYGSRDLVFSGDGSALAVARAHAGECHIQLRSLPSGKRLGHLPGHAGWTVAMDFSADGRYLLNGGSDGTVLVWDVAAKARLAHEAALSEQDLKKYWQELGDAKDGKGILAIDALASDPRQAVAMLEKALSPVPADGVEKLLADLDDESFARRAKATHDLEMREFAVRAALERTLQEKKASLECQRRVETLLKKLKAPDVSPALLRSWRAIVVLEQIASPEARQLLQTLASGAPEARLTTDAQSALERLKQWP